jgi:hypothetical protein
MGILDKDRKHLWTKSEIGVQFENAVLLIILRGQ